MKELKEYIKALYACREMTGTLPYNVPEKLEEFIKNMEDEWGYPKQTLEERASKPGHP